MDHQILAESRGDCVFVSPVGVSLGAPSGFSLRACALSLLPQGSGGLVFCLSEVFCLDVTVVCSLCCVFLGGLLCAVWLLCAPRECLLEHLLGSP